MELTQELIAKAKEAKTVSELVHLAKENGEEMPIEQAEKIFDRIHKSGELTDEELDNVAGGGCMDCRCPKCGSERHRVENVRYVYCTDCGEFLGWTK